MSLGRPPMTIVVELPSVRALELEYLLLDINGTLSSSGRLIPGVAGAVAGLRDALSIRLLSADTFGTAKTIAAELGTQLQHVSHGDDKRAFAERLGPPRCAAIGNGLNDVAMLSVVALGIAVVGPEGASPSAVAAADIVCESVLDALALLYEPARIVATLRA